ncbi:MAG: diacylglycerol kinase family protein [Planctomycetia bacterium]|nr:diacylglycerol kinase family protein [Planctomycetia bacterium]
MAQFIDPRHRSWPRKFRRAARGLGWGLRTERNFSVHLVVAAAVVAAAIALDASRLEWCMLVLCVAVVLGAELFNTAIEQLARAVTRDHNEHVRDALDTSSGAVLLTAIGAAIVGSLVFVYRLGCFLNWWSG